MYTSMIWLLVLPLVTICEDLQTYWIDDSCSPHVTDAILDMKLMARRAYERLESSDPLIDEYFHLLLTSWDHEWRGSRDYDLAQSELHCLLQVPNLSCLERLSRIAMMTQEPDPVRANFRYYCDNDRRTGPDRRWQLKEDPRRRPRAYVPQMQRPMPHEATKDPNDPMFGSFQEWWDPFNRM